MPSLEIAKLLDEYSSNALIQMAAFHNVLPKQQKNKSILVSLLSGAITDPEQIRQSYESLSKAERAALDAILRRDGETSVRNIQAELNRLQLIDPKARVEYGEYAYQYRPDPRAQSTRRLADILSRLMIRGLVFTTDGVSDGVLNQNKRTFYDAVQKVFIPVPIRRHLPQPPPLPENVEKITDLKTVQEGSARVFQRELYLYWSYIRDHTPYLTLKDEISKPALKDINSLLLVRGEMKTGKTENDYPRLRFLRSMLAAMKLINEKASEVIEAGPGEFFTLGPADRVKRTYQAWTDTDRFNELLLLPDDVRPRGSATNPLIPARQPVIKARKFIIDQVRKLKPLEWVSLQSLVDRIYEHDYEFLLSRRPVASYYYYGTINPYEYLSNELMLTFRGIAGEEDGWQKVEANLIRGVIFGPLFWIGLVDLGWAGKEEGPPTAFRLTSLGAWVFGLGEQPEIPMEGGRVIVQPTMQIMALDPIQDAVLANLDRFAERISAERAVEYRLTRASVYAAQQAGWDAAQIKTVLEQYSGSSLPPNVDRTLDEWQAQYERIVIHPRVTLLHGDPQAVDQVANNSATAGWIAMRPLPEVALLKSEQAIPRVTKMLRAQEILPVIHTRATPQPNAVTCSEDGEVHFNGRVASLYLHGHLAPFANPAETGYRITPDSVQRAVRSGLSAPEILQRLEAVHSGPLPEKLVRSIRAWSKHYGSAALAQVTLLQMRDEAALNELLADPEIGPLIRRFAPQPPALAEVDEKNIERLRALLAERGIDLDKQIK